MKTKIRLPILTERLLLRNYQAEDWERVHIYGSQREFSRYEIWGPNTPKDSQNFVEEMVLQAGSPRRFKYDFAVCLKENGLLIGGCGLRRETELSHVANLGWAINPEFQSRGFATEAAGALIKLGFEVFHLAVIYATCDKENTPSFKVMEKLGMKRVGYIAGHIQMKGRLRDTYRYELLNA